MKKRSKQNQKKKKKKSKDTGFYDCHKNVYLLICTKENWDEAIDKILVMN